MQSDRNTSLPVLPIQGVSTICFFLNAAISARFHELIDLTVLYRSSSCEEKGRTKAIHTIVLVL